MLHSSHAAGHRRLKSAIGLVAAIAACCGAASADPTAVWTEHNDNNRTGQNLDETVLTPANVNTTQFGKLFAYNLDDQSYSQPLYVPGLTMAVDGHVHNVVFVTTVNNSIYAFDADSSQANGGQPLWQVSLTPTGARPPTASDASAQGACGGNYRDFAGKYGTVGTPVIDTSTNTLYVVARTVESGVFIQRLHALSLVDGTEKFGGPVSIAGTYDGVAFDPTLNNQRTALALVNGNVYIGWSSHCDNGPYHGFVMAYNASTLQQTAAWAATTANGRQAGVWQGGQALTADSTGNVYAMTGNGTWDGTSNFGESFVKLSAKLQPLDYFTPSNWAALNGADLDLGSAGSLGIPGTNLMFGGGKQGMVYLLDIGALGHENAVDAVVQEFQASFPQKGATGHIHGGPVYFNSAHGQYIYLWGENDYPRVYQFTNGAQPNQGVVNSTPVALGPTRAPRIGIGMPGGFLSISADGNQNGIIWASTPDSGDANMNTVTGIMYAYDAQTFASGKLTELWDSDKSTRDTMGNFAKFTYPTIANGKVYVSTFGSTASGTGQLLTYGELATAPVIAPNGGKFTTSEQVTLTDSTAGAAIWYTTDGTKPVPGAGTAKLYSGPFTLTATSKFNAVAARPGDTAGAESSATFTIVVSSPSFRPTGTVAIGTAVTLADSTPGASIYYTMDGSTPSPGVGATALYTAPFPINVNCTVEAIGTLSGDTSSSVVSEVYGARVAEPAFTPAAEAIAAPTPITIATATSGASIWYTVDGSTPSPGVGTSTLYLGPVTVNPGTTLQAVAALTGDTVSSARSGAYPQAAAAKPTFSPNGGTRTSSVIVTVTDSTPGSTIYYTLDGSTPTIGGGTTKVYTTPFSLTAYTVVNAFATAPTYLNSPVVKATFTLVTSTPTFSPAAGTLTYPAKISAHDTNAATTIYYTTDGSTPTAGGGGSTQTYTGTFTLTGPGTVQAVAIAPGQTASTVASVTYN